MKQKNPSLAEQSEDEGVGAMYTSSIPLDLISQRYQRISNSAAVAVTSGVASATNQAMPLDASAAASDRNCNNFVTTSVNGTVDQPPTSGDPASPTD